MLARSAVSSRSATFGRRVACNAQNGTRVTMRAGNWFPGSDAPAWLPDNMAGNFGFDPLELAKEPASLKRFQEAELQHCRWAMLGAAGCLAVEVLGYGNWVDAQAWAVNGGSATYFGATNPLDLNTLIAIQFVGFAIAESRRGDEPDQTKRCYPGGSFDPMGMSKGDMETLKLKEIKNGRLAMMACLGFFAQYQATGKGPVAALSEHLANPWNANFATNGVSLPF